jgi:GSCFA family
MHTLNLELPKYPELIDYRHKILLTGSCFTEHIAGRLAQHKFNILTNPNGILFNPLSVADSLCSYVANKQYHASELFYLNELWNSWDHHSVFSHIDQNAALDGINRSQQTAHEFIKTADWVIITLGSGFQYYFVADNRPVSNNHRAPAQWFEKRLLSINSITESVKNACNSLINNNPNIKIIFTISPVRHIRDGVTENNRSKARLIEAVHELCATLPHAYYFPAYEIVIDILRDYRYYDIDYVHPNFLATGYVWEQFVKAFFTPTTTELMEKVQEITYARNHRPRFPETEAHKAFKLACLRKIRLLQEQCPYLDFAEETEYFK